MHERKKIAIIGDSTSVMGFRPFGIDAYAVDDPDELQGAWATASTGDYAIIFVTEPLYEDLLPQVKKFESRTTPAVTAIPSAAGATGAGKRHIDAIIERVLGTAMKKGKTRGVES